MKTAGKAIRIEGNRFLRRSRNLRVRRRRRWRWLTRRWALFSLLALLAGGGGTLMARGRPLLARSGLFQVRRFTFQNLQRTRPEELSELVRPLASGGLFDVDLGALRERLESHRWVRHARIRRRLPDALHITIQERRPEALARLHGRLFLIDAEGSPIEPFGPEGPPRDLPVLVGPPARGGADREEALRRGVRLLQELRARFPELAPRIERLDLRSPDAIDLNLREHPALLRLPPEGGLGSLPWYLRIRDRIHRRVPGTARIDLRWESQISVAIRGGRQ